MRNLGLMSFLFGCFFVPAAGAHAADYWPRVGQMHPDFVLPNIADRRPVSLSQFRGKRVLLIQFASW